MNLENKNVCIVSYANYMKNKNMGEKIDSHDIVVRLNNGIHLLNEKDFGEKNDIASFTISTIKLGIVENTFHQIYNQKQNFLQICKFYNFQNVMGFINELENDYWKEFLEKNMNLYNCITKFNTDYEFLNAMGLTCGLSTIIFMLKHKPQKLFICGFDFTMNMHPDYSKYYPIPERINKTYDQIQNNWHSTIFELFIFKNLYLKYNFQVDDNLHQILNQFNSDDLNKKIYDAEFKQKLKYNFVYGDALNTITNYIDSDKK